MICALGDLLLDVVVRLDGPVAEDTDTYGRTHVGAGGQAANVAAWVTALGGRARLVGKRARDSAGRIVAEELERLGVQVVGPETQTGTGTVVSIATPDGRRAMLSDRGVSPEFRPEELDPAWLDGCEWLYVSGYGLTGSPLRETVLTARRVVPRVSLDLSSTGAIRQVGAEPFRALVMELAPDLVFANEEEAALVGPLGVETVVKLGARGCRVAGREYPAVPVELVDATGAGDAFDAGYLLGGAEHALAAAARCVARMGAMPS
jgi:sugar/nucleoside kinase (ribokinase family)